jgi:hypothetical protein
VNRAPPIRREQIRRRVLLAHAAITAAAGFVLIVRPAAIPATVGIHLAPDAYLLSYLLAAAELGFATLSWLGARSDDAAALRAIILACVVLHAASGALEAVAWRAHAAPVLLANLAVRLIIVAGFLWLLPRADEWARSANVRARTNDAR